MQVSGASHALKVMSCVEKYGHSPHESPERAFDPLVLHSWNRCVHEHALHPGARTVEVMLDEASLHRQRDRMGEFYFSARSEMENLYQQIANRGFVVLLTDTEGNIIELIGDSVLNDELVRFGLRLGACWSERYAGTNGMGTCLVERKSITIHRDDHFLSCNTSLSCSAAPVRDPQGRLLAVLDASCASSQWTRPSQLHTTALVSMSARVIENRNFVRVYRNEWVLRFHVRQEFVGLLTDGMLAIDESGTVLAANPSAVEQLGLVSRDDLVGKPIDELLELPADWARHGDTSMWPMHSRSYGQRYFGTIRSPLPAGKRPVLVQAPQRKRIIRPLIPQHRGSYTLSDIMAGADPRMAYNARCAKRLVDKNVSILLRGETGTGKDALASAIHAASRRADQPFVAVNCASIPESLIESELFGYRPGAFTGARREGMRGRIRQSSGGTLFLDEIGDMPAELQTRLLRVLEQREILPLGGETPVPVDLHVISATHRNLTEMVAQGQFREDLYYRLNGVTLTLPALCERQDREMIIRCILGEESTGVDGEVGIEQDAFDRLMDYHWPGNIRQLRNCIRTMLALCDDGVVRMADLPPELSENPAPAGASPDRTLPDAPADSVPEPGARNEGNPLASAERDALLRVLEQYRWNVTAAAAALEVSRNTMYRKMKKHDITISR